MSEQATRNTEPETVVSQETADKPTKNPTKDVQQQTRYRTALRIAGIEGIEGFSDVAEGVPTPEKPGGTQQLAHSP